MSATLTIKHTKYYDERIPMASAGAYVEYWKNPAIELGLTLLPSLYEFDQIKDINDAQQLLAEIDALYEYAQQSDDVKYQKHAQARMPRVIKALKEAVAEWDEVEYIIVG